MKFFRFSQFVLVCLLLAATAYAQAPLPTPMGQLVVLGNASVQAERFELGQRLRATESAWDAAAHPEKRLDAVARPAVFEVV